MRQVAEQWPQDPLRPARQWRVVELNLARDPPDREAAQRAVREFNASNLDVAAWTRANQDRPGALADQRSRLAFALASEATRAHQQALLAAEQGDQAAATAAANQAAEQYAAYIQRFPDAADLREIQTYLAGVLELAGRLSEAVQVLETLVAAPPHPYQDLALWRLMWVRRMELDAAYGSIDARPPDARVERVVLLPSGKERPVYALDEAHQRFIAAADALVEATPTDPEVAAALAQHRPSLAWLAASTLVSFGRFDEALPRLERIERSWPERDEASYARSHIIDIYFQEEDMAAARVRMRSGCTFPGSAAPVGYVGCTGFPQTAEQLAFNQAFDLTKTDRAAAAAAFLAFVDEFPDSPWLKDALYNAANSHDILGRVGEANALFEDYVNRYPRDQRSANLLFRVASGYAGTLELERAVSYWEQIPRLHPGFPDAATALYNAGFLRVGLGDPAGAAAAFERYAATWPEQYDAEQVFFLAGAQWEWVGDRAAADFYKRYLKRYPDTSPDHTLVALQKLAIIADKGKDPRLADRAWSELLQAAQRQAAAGPLSARGRALAAAAALRQLPRTPELGAQHLDAMADQVRSLVETWQDLEASSAALTRLGEAAYAAADRRHPRAPDDPGRLPEEALGRASLEAVLALASAEHTWSPWQSRALSLLAVREPDDYNPEWIELRGVYEPLSVVSAGPIGVR